ATDSLDVTSRSIALLLMFVFESSACRDCRRSARRAASTTLAPASPKHFAKCAPSPEEAPVMRAVLPLRSNGFIRTFLASVRCGGNMDLGLKGKRVLVTGGSKSIGRAIVDAFVAEGGVVGFCARDAKLVKQREDEWRAKQARVQGAALDVTDDPALKKWIDGFAAEGGIDHFVANVSALGTDDTPEGW